MEILKDTPYRNIPSELFHYTSIDNFESIVQGNNEDEKEICFWAFSSDYKNDKDELKYGQTIYKRVRQKLRDRNKQKYLTELLDKCYLLHMTVMIYVVLQVIEKIKEYILIHMVFKKFLSLKNFIAKFQLKKCLTI